MNTILHDVDGVVGWQWVELGLFVQNVIHYIRTETIFPCARTKAIFWQHSMAFPFALVRICAAILPMRYGTMATGRQESLEGSAVFIIQVVRF